MKTNKVYFRDPSHLPEEERQEHLEAWELIKRGEIPDEIDRNLRIWYLHEQEGVIYNSWDFKEIDYAFIIPEKPSPKKPKYSINKKTREELKNDIARELFGCNELDSTDCKELLDFIMTSIDKYVECKDDEADGRIGEWQVCPLCIGSGNVPQSYQDLP